MGSATPPEATTRQVGKWRAGWKPGKSRRGDANLAAAQCGIDRGMGFLREDPPHRRGPPRPAGTDRKGGPESQRLLLYPSFIARITARNSPESFTIPAPRFSFAAFRPADSNSPKAFHPPPARPWMRRSRRLLSGLRAESVCKRSDGPSPSRGEGERIRSSMNAKNNSDPSPAPFPRQGAGERRGTGRGLPPFRVPPGERTFLKGYVLNGPQGWRRRRKDFPPNLDHF